MKHFTLVALLLILFSTAGFSQTSYSKKLWSIPTGIDKKDIVPNVLIVKTKSGSTNFQGRLNKAFPEIKSLDAFNKGNSALRSGKTAVSNIFVMSFQDGIEHASVINSLLTDSDIVYAEPMYIRHTSFIPNDPGKSSQTHLAQIKAFEGWDILNDASDVIIAIVDSGVAIGHADLSSNIFLNTSEIEGNGIDDDNDGYIDNYLGWDFVGSSISAIINAGSPVNWDLWEDNNPDTDGSDHGTHVAGIASAGFNNGVGISGVGAGARIMALKCGEDAGGSYSRSIFRGYDAIVYAAEHGADVINCSWGGAGYSQFEQDIINYATELGSLIIAAASNDGNSELSYPASYDNVLSVANVKSDDVRASSSTYNYQVDVAAPGSDIYSTVFGSDYGVKTGTSMSSPVVAGVAALVKAKRPSLTPAQIGEVIRVTSDDINPLHGGRFKYKLGKGRVNIYRALTELTPSVRFRNLEFLDEDFSLQSGDEVGISLDFVNFLNPVSNLTATLKVDNSSITILDGTETIGALGTMQEVSKENAFTFQISGTARDNLEVTFRVEFTDGSGYTDWQAYTVTVNPTYINILNGEYATSVTSIGRLGYLESGSTPVGLGMVYNEENLLYELGFMVGNSATQLSSSVRTDTDPSDDFEIVDRIAAELIEENKRASFDFKGTMDDSKSTTPLGLNISYNALAWKEDGSNRFYIMEYVVKNSSNQNLTGLYAGLFSDWDILEDASANIGGYDATRKMGYVTTNAPSDFYASMAVLTKDVSFNYKAIDNSTFEFTDANKFSALSGGVGSTILSSADVSNIIGLGPFDLAINEERKLAFLISVGSNVTQLEENYDRADYLYNTSFSIASPPDLNLDVCFGESAEISLNGFTDLRWYDRFEGGNVIYEGETFTTEVLNGDVLLYVAALDGNGNESIRSLIRLNVGPSDAIDYIEDLVLCDGESITLKASEGSEYLWSTGAVTQEIVVDQAGTYYVDVTNTDSQCSTRSVELVIESSSSPQIPQIQSVSPFCLGDEVTLTVSNVVGGLTYRWEGPNDFSQTGEEITLTDFQNNQNGEYVVYAISNGCETISEVVSITSDVEVPSVTSVDGVLSTTYVADNYQWYLNDELLNGETGSTIIPESSGNYTLEVSNDLCNAFSNEVAVVVTGLKPSTSNINVFPNPAFSELNIESPSKHSNFSVFDMSGKLRLSGKLIETGGNRTMDISVLNKGVYLLVLSGSSSGLNSEVVTFVKK